jgi:hydroxyethylthiazole kinase-like uncharacterized protein yjeF
MEQAARSLSDFLISATYPTSTNIILFLCGPGNNGADAIAAARQLLLHPRLKPVVLTPGGSPAPNSLLALQLNSFKKLGGELLNLGQNGLKSLPEAPSVVVDGLFGVGLKRPIGGIYAETIRQAAEIGVPVLAVDCPSGLNCNDGTVLGPCLPATWTLSFIGAKQGFSRNAGPSLCGQIQIADIGVRRELADQWLVQRRAQKTQA